MTHGGVMLGMAKALGLIPSTGRKETKQDIMSLLFLKSLEISLKFHT